jgi:hypothetical protein
MYAVRLPLRARIGVTLIVVIEEEAVVCARPGICDIERGAQTLNVCMIILSPG